MVLVTLARPSLVSSYQVTPIPTRHAGLLRVLPRGCPACLWPLAPAVPAAQPSPHGHSTVLRCCDHPPADASPSHTSERLFCSVLSPLSVAEPELHRYRYLLVPSTVRGTERGFIPDLGVRAAERGAGQTVDRELAISGAPAAGAPKSPPPRPRSRPHRTAPPSHRRQPRCRRFANCTPHIPARSS